MSIKVLWMLGVGAVIAAINGAVRRFGGLDVVVTALIVCMFIFLGMLVLRARNE